MLDEKPLSYNASNIRSSAGSYEDANWKLKERFTSEKRRRRLLHEWRNIKLTAWSRHCSAMSKSAVSRRMCHKLTSNQRQLNPDNRNPRILRGQLVAAADIDTGSGALNKQSPSTAHDALQKFTTVLSSKPGTAFSQADASSEAYYGLGRCSEGRAERKQSSTMNSFKRSSKRKKFARVDCCWVCGKNHRANDFYNPNKVRVALQKNKKNGPYILVEIVVSAFFAGSNSESSSNLVFESDEQDKANTAMTHDKICGVNKKLEHTLSNNTF